jgi:cytochrome c
MTTLTNRLSCLACHYSDGTLRPAANPQGGLGNSWHSIETPELAVRQ